MALWKCEDGRIFEVPDKCCLVCEHCCDIWYDGNGPYLTFCSHDYVNEEYRVKHGIKGTCKFYKLNEINEAEVSKEELKLNNKSNHIEDNLSDEDIDRIEKLFDELKESFIETMVKCGIPRSFIDYDNLAPFSSHKGDVHEFKK